MPRRQQRSNNTSGCKNLLPCDHVDMHPAKVWSPLTRAPTAHNVELSVVGNHVMRVPRRALFQANPVHAGRATAERLGRAVPWQERQLGC